MQRHTAASYTDVQDMAEALRLSESAYQRAQEVAGLAADRQDWLHHIDRFLVAVGALLVVAGVAAFFAWNWAELGHLAKFFLIQTGVVLTAVLAWRLGLDAVAGRMSLFATAFLVGILLAVFGQVYQTGADPYGLFLAWGVLILPLAVIGRQAGIWMLVQLLLNLTLILYYTQVLKPPEGWWELARLLGPLVWLGTTVFDSTLASYLFALNAVALVVWEVGAARGIVWMQGTVFPRLIALAAFGTVLAPTLIIIVAAGLEGQARLSLVSPLLFAVATVACLYYYQRRRLDLFILTCALLGIIMAVTSFVIRHMLEGSGGLLVLAVFVIAQVTAATWWLRRVAQTSETGR